MAPFRVAHVLRKYDPEQWGGTETHVVAVASRLRSHGWEAEVHAPHGPTAPDRMLPSHVPLARFHSFCPFVGPADKRRALYANAGNIASLDEIAALARDRSLTLSHVHTGKRIGGAVRTAMRLTGRPYVVSVHGPMLAEPTLVSEDTRARLDGLWDVGKPLGWLLGARRVLDDAARVICFNADEHGALLDRVGRRAVRMDHGVDRGRLGSGSTGRARERWPELGDAPVVALLGRMAAQKNQLLAVRAFARGAPAGCRLVFAGAETDRGWRDLVEGEARSLGVRERVHFLGNLDPSVEVPDLLARADLLLVPSLHEAFGLAVLEGWAAGRAVLFARHSGLADIAGRLRDDSCTLPSLDEHSWADAIARALARPEQREAWAQNGLTLVEERYSWDVVTRALVELYAEVVDENQSRRAGAARRHGPAPRRINAHPSSPRRVDSSARYGDRA